MWAQTPAPKPAAATAPKPAAPAASTPGAVKPPAPKPAAATRPATAPAKPAAPKVMTGDEKIVYALGLSMSRSLSQFDLSPAEIDIIKQALTDAAAGKPAVELDTWGPKIQGLATSRGAAASVKQKAASAEYLAKAAAEAGAVKTDSGLVYKELTPGTGASPKASDTVKVHYRGTLVNGTEFDNS